MDTTLHVGVIVVIMTVLIALGWLATSALIALGGGWHKFAARFRSATEPTGERFRFVTLTLGTGLLPARYRNALTVTVGPAGIGLSVIFFFRIMHPPLFIPWSAVESVRPERSWLVNHMAVAVRGFDKRLFIRGPAGRKILEAFSARVNS